MISISELLGKRIKKIREAQRIKQVELANIIDIEPTNLSKIEKGVHFPKDETIYKIAKALNVDFRELFYFEQIQEKEDLLEKINQMLENSKTEDLHFYYKLISAYNEKKYQ